MNISKRIGVALLALLICVGVIFGTAVPAFAAAPTKMQVEYEGNGKVEVDFYQKVSYKNAKVTVKDTDGKTYSAVVIKKDNDDFDFRIKNFKEGKTYKFTITGIKKSGTKDFSKITGSFKIPKKAAATTISSANAKSIAINNAVKKYNISKSSVRDLEIERDNERGYSTWEVSFEAKRNGAWYDFEYQIIRSSGKILYCEAERD